MVRADGKSDPNDVQVYFRASESLLEELDVKCARLRVKRPRGILLALQQFIDSDSGVSPLDRPKDIGVESKSHGQPGISGTELQEVKALLHRTNEVIEGLVALLKEKPGSSGKAATKGGK